MYQAVYQAENVSNKSSQNQNFRLRPCGPRILVGKAEMVPDFGIQSNKKLIERDDLDLLIASGEGAF